MRKSPFRSFDQARFKKSRSKFSASSLLLAGAISLAGLFAANDANALSGTLTSAGTTTTPRDSGGASGGATLIHTAAAASATSESSSSQQVTGPSESASTPNSAARTSGGTRRRAQTEEGGRRRTSEGTTTNVRNSRRGGGKAVVEGKDKTVAPVPAAPDRVHFSVSSGYETRYMFHGLDIIGFNSKAFKLEGTGLTAHIRDLPSSAIMYDNADVAFKGAHFGIGYIRAISPTYPLFQSPSPIGISTAIPGLNQRHYYQEVDVTADYTASIVGGILDGTVGYNSYFFPYRDYKSTSYQGEIFLRLAYKQLKYVVPSFTFYRYVSKQDDNNVGNLNGNFVEFRIDGAVPIYHNNMFAVDFAPYVAASYNISYLRYNNQDTGGWNSLETGIKLPTRFGNHFSVTPYGNYGMDLSSSDNLPINNFTGRGFGERTHFWGGVTVAYSF